jgi:hypothetical protein
VNPGYRAPTDAAFGKWVSEARLMFTRDGRSPPDATELARWLFESDSPDAKFWRSNVMGVPKFREQYDKLAAKKRRSEDRAIDQPGRSGSSQYGVIEASRRILERARARQAG